MKQKNQLKDGDIQFISPHCALKIYFFEKQQSFIWIILPLLPFIAHFGRCSRSC